MTALKTAGRSAWPQRLAAGSVLALAAFLLTYVARSVDQQTIEVVASRRLMPRWDLATHLDLGWVDYRLLVTGRLHSLLWDFWSQGYWPPMLSIWQIPFYVGLGGGITSGLRSSLTAFVLTGVAGTALIWRDCKPAALLPASVFLALLMSSPYLLAYASVTMTETLGALVQLLVLLAYSRYRQRPTPSAARLFALALTTLFFTKYNYFLLLAIPLLLHEWLERTSGATVAERSAAVWRSARRALNSPTIVVVVLYLIALLLVMRTGGFDVHLFGRTISVHTIGNSGYVVLYALIARLWFLHRRGWIDWSRVIAADPLVRPLLIWFVVPVTVWLASPYPNHIRDFANLVVNRPLGESTVGGGIAVYVHALRSDYFYSEWILACVIAAFLLAAVRHRHQSPALRWVILAAPIQLAVIAIHQTRFPRFLLLTVVLLCLAAACEVGRWFRPSRAGRISAALFAGIVLVAGVAASRNIVAEERFRVVAFENYTNSPALRAALDAIRADLTADDRLAIIGQGNELSPALFRWELGPPSGRPCFPVQIGGARGTDLSLATAVLLMEPLERDGSALDMTSYYLARRQAVLDFVNRGELALAREFLLPELHVGWRLYRRTSTAPQRAGCQ